ncbi:ABC transporter permease [Aquamicrobium sp. LC103]|uniref:ABC transporter permease n=1 Tax=Aquamicrobium sp. LC103 TaxID=1120658 RepID=UPI00069B5C64|nr:ABC transporter permease [Aquamicrobium sp. LC103]TKT69214.1 ABC transporter permease [Aquamicrobium sp. LC103]
MVVLTSSTREQDHGTRRGAGSFFHAAAFHPIVRHFAIFAVLIGAWEIGARTGTIDPLVLPAPSAIAEAMWRLFVTQRNIWWHLLVTIGEVLAGFTAGSILGIGLAIVVGLNPMVRKLLKPYVIVLEATPRIAIGPLIIAALGFGWSSKITIVMLVCFFAPFINTLSGMLSVNEGAYELFRSLRANKWQIFTKLMLLDAMPVIMAGLRLAMASALSGALVAEFISASEGMGVLLKRYTASLNMASAFGCLLTLTALGFAIYRTMEAVGNRIVFWRHAPQMDAVSRRRQAQWQRNWGA